MLTLHTVLYHICFTTMEFMKLNITWAKLTYWLVLQMLSRSPFLWWRFNLRLLNTYCYKGGAAVATRAWCLSACARCRWQFAQWAPHGSSGDVDRNSGFGHPDSLLDLLDIQSQYFLAFARRHPFLHNTNLVYQCRKPIFFSRFWGSYSDMGLTIRTS